MSDQSPPSSPGNTGPQRRRSSFAELFTSRPVLSTSQSSASPPSTSTVPATVPAAQPRRGLSISTLGFGGNSPTSGSPFTAFAKQRRASVSTSSASGSPEFRNSFGDEPAVLEEGDSTAPTGPPFSPSFARRVSFGAQALRDVKQGSNVGGPAGGGEGFNWSEALRDKTKRSPSFSSGTAPFASGVTRNRSSSTTAPEPPKEIPKPPPTPTRMKKPDHLGERMLRGEFMMD